MKNGVSKKEIILFVCALGILAIIIVFGFIMDKAENNSSIEDETAYSDYVLDQIYYGSQWYVPDDSVESILVIGLDKMVEGDTSKQDSEQADFLAVVVIDSGDESYRILHINRDTMASIPQTDAFGEVYGYTKGQITLAHTYGRDDRIRCRNTINTVEKLLYGVNIDHYISLTMDAVPILNDSVGGVTVELMDDFTNLDESYVKGAVVTLKGNQALTYVRARGGLEDSSNVHRMERQQQYIAALIETLKGYDFDNAMDTVRKVNDYLVTDYTMDQLSRLVEKYSDFEYKGTVSPEGEAVVGEKYMEFYTDDQALQSLVVDLFYKLRD